MFNDLKKKSLNKKETSNKQKTGYRETPRNEAGLVSRPYETAVTQPKQIHINFLIVAHIHIMSKIKSNVAFQ